MHKDFTILVRITFWDESISISDSILNFVEYKLIWKKKTKSNTNVNKKEKCEKKNGAFAFGANIFILLLRKLFYIYIYIHEYLESSLCIENSYVQAYVFFLLTRYYVIGWLFSSSTKFFSLFFFYGIFSQISVCVIFFICKLNHQGFFSPSELVNRYKNELIYIYIYIPG